MDRDIMSGNVKLAMSHVVPCLVQKILKGQDPLHILGSSDQVRHYTYGGDLAKGIRVCIENPTARNTTLIYPLLLEPPLFNLRNWFGRRFMETASPSVASPIHSSNMTCRSVRQT